MGIPALQPNGELPPVEHEATLDEVEQIYGCSTIRRKKLMSSLRKAATNLASSGVTKIWIDGSFVTAKPDPSDIDGCWEYTPNVDIERLDPVFFGNLREMRSKYSLEFFISNIIEAESGLPFPGFFQSNRDGQQKGIVVVRLGGQNDHQ